MSIELYNVQHEATVHCSLLIVHGKVTAYESGIITVSHQGNVFPPLCYEVNNYFFKALVHLEPGQNNLLFTHSPGSVVYGVPQYSSSGEFEANARTMTINHVPLLQNKPIHLCLLLAKDSPGTFDTNPYKVHEEKNDLDLAIKKLRIGGRLMEAFTNEQMLRAGFGNRTFRFVEEYTKDTQFASEAYFGGKFRNTIKIHILRSKKTLAELRDPNLAQQNPNGTNTGGLFGIAMDALVDYGGPFAPENYPVQAAVMFLDSRWDANLNMVLAHAALGGGDARFNLAIFGSHGLHSWPAHLEHIVPAFQDTTRNNIDETSGHCDQCGTSWEFLCLSCGAFLHEIGHLLGCPHQVNGVMLRDYVTLNRSFTTRELYCQRTGSESLCPIMPKEECTWHRLDLLRFLYQSSFDLASDYQDPSFQKHVKNPGKPVLLTLGDGGALIRADSGIYAIEVYKDGLAHGYIEYLPKTLGGEGTQNEVFVNTEILRNTLPADKQDGDFDVLVLATGKVQSEFKNFIKTVSDSSSFIYSDFGLGRGPLQGIKSATLGSSGKEQNQMIIFDPKRVVNVRVYHGSYLDGIRIDFADGSGTRASPQAPPLPKRNYKSPFSNLIQDMKDLTVGSHGHSPPQVSGSVQFGNKIDSYTDFPLHPGETIERLNFRCGSWIDAIQIVTNTGRHSPMLGSQSGGGPGSLYPPPGYEIIGLHGNAENWVTSIGLIYIRKPLASYN